MNLVLSMRPEACKAWLAKWASNRDHSEKDPPVLSVTLMEPGSVRESSAAQVKLPKVAGSVAIVPIRGVIGQRAGSSEYGWFDTGTENLGQAIDSLMANSAVGAIVLNVDSPGGVVSGTPELAEKIRNHVASGVKPVYSVANPDAASAAYWLASQASKMFVTPSGEAGSVGVWSAHVNASKAYEDAGLEITLVSAGKYKVEGHPFAPLDDEARAEMQRSVDFFYDLFTADVAKGRGVKQSVVKSDYGEGRMLKAPDAVKAGMVDAVATLEAVVGALVKPAQGNGKRLAMAEAQFRLASAEE